MIYVEDFEGRVGIMTQIEDLDAVAAALDRRGVRELALSTAIDKAYKYDMQIFSCFFTCARVLPCHNTASFLFARLLCG